jgi:hypothetical protein
MKKELVMNEQVVGKMAELLKEVPVNERDEVVVKAKNLIVEKEKRVKGEDLEKLFDKQIQTLKDRGCPPVILEMLTEQRSQVIEKASKMAFEKGRIPFLAVIPRIYLTIYSQMAMVRNKDKVGYTYLDAKEITDVVKTPDKPYYIFDVEDGEAMLGKAPQDAEKLINKQGRRCVTEVEVIALGIQTDVLSRHFVDATGSRYGSSDGMPGLWLLEGEPELGWYYLFSAVGGWGSASCGSN